MSRAGSAVALVAVLPAIASAAQWDMLPQLSLTADTDTNRRLEVPPRPSDGAVLGGGFAITRKTEVSTFSLIPRGSISRYSGDDALDSEDWGVNSMYHRGGERFALDAQAAISDDSTLTTELGETGFVEGNTRRHFIQASTSLTQYLGTRHLLRYQLGMSDIDYDRTLGTGLVGYRYPSFDLLYAVTMSPRLDVTLSANAARLEVPLTRVETDTRGAQLGFRFRVSERFDLEARAGRTNTQARGRSDEAQSYFASASWHDERSNLALSLSQDVQPNGIGILVHAEDLRLAYSFRLTERLMLDTSARASVREDTEADLRRYDYRFGVVSLALSWKLDESWTLGVAGSYVRQEYEVRHDDADGHRVGLRLAWRPQR
jgi:hypothetical protein